MINRQFTPEEIQFFEKTFGIIYNKEIFDPKVDFAFKKMFTENSKESREALIDFINSVMELTGEKKIKNMTILNTAVVTESPSEKQSLLDVWVRAENGEEMIIEMQLEDTDDFVKRTEYILAKSFCSQQIKGKFYADLKKTALISIMNFGLFSGENREQKFYSKFRFKDVEDGYELSDDIELHYFELVKLKELLKKSRDTLTAKEMWAIFLKYAPDKKQEDLITYIREKEEGINMAANVLEKISKDDAERVAYQENLIFMMDQYSKQEYMRKKGFEEGVDIGKMEGIAIGEAIGEVKGEAKNRLEIARKMVLDGEPIEKIKKYSELSEKEILEIKEKI